jgi:hypothetical protein
MADEPAGTWLEIVLEAFRDHEQEPRELGVGHRWMTSALATLEPVRDIRRLSRGSTSGSIQD